MTVKKTGKAIGGLIPAPHTPMDSSGRLDTSIVARQVAHFVGAGVHGAFVGGTTGECLSLSVDERIALAEAWVAAASGTPLTVIVQVGGNCVAESRRLAKRAAMAGADAVAAMAPSFFRPTTVDQLLDYCRPIAEAAESTPFFFYDIPVMTNVRLSMPEFLGKAVEKLPTLLGLKYTNDDLVQLQECLAVAPDRYRILYGFDELLLPALALGVHGAVGSTYNFNAANFLALMAAVERGDWSTARQLQLRGVQIIRCLSRYGFMAAAKATMGMCGVDCGSVRPPLQPLDAGQIAKLRAELNTLGLFS